MQMVITCDDAYLRSIVTQRDPYGVNIDEYLSPVLERELAILLEKELAYHNEIEYLKNLPGFELEKAFISIDDADLGYIDSTSIDEFLRRMGFQATEEEITAIIRRLDVSADAKVSFAEFEEAMRVSTTAKPTSEYQNDREYEYRQDYGSHKNDAGSHSSHHFKLSNPSIVKLENLNYGYYLHEPKPRVKEVRISSPRDEATYESPTKLPPGDVQLSRSKYNKH